jgi:hypothetical protein
MASETLTTKSPIEIRVDSNSHTSIEAIRHAVHEARAALALLLVSAGVDATKTRESARLLNVNRGMVWRVSRVIGAEDDVTAATHLPGTVGMERLIEACRTQGVSEEVLESSRNAVRKFHEVVQRHSGDRRTLEILLANAGAQSTSANMEGARRAMFEGGCAVWGVRAEVRLRAMFLAPSAGDPTMLDQTDVAGYVGFRRLRGVPWPMSYKAVYTDTGAADAPREDPIDEAGANGSGLPLIREFCLPQDLRINTIQTARATRHELPVMPDGPEAATCVFGAIQRRIHTARWTPECQFAGALVVMDTPVERVMFDTFVHKSLGLPGPPLVRLLDRMTRTHGFSREDLDSETLPIDAQVRPLGPGSAGTVTAHVPWYPRMIERVCARLGLRSDEFVAHRMEMVYPPIPTALVAMFDLPD